MDYLISNSKQKIIKNNICQGIRIDGRKFFEQRNLKILYNNKLDGAEVQLGNTKVFCKLITNIIEPNSGKKNEGKFLLRIDLALLLNKKGLQMNIKEMGDEINKVLEKSIKESKALDVESLNIKIGKFCWEIILELTLLHNDGNIIDTMNYAALAVLLKYEYKPISVNENNLEILEQRKNKKFSLNHIPILQTFGIINLENKFDDEDVGDEYIIFDPNLDEESVCNGHISVAVNIYGDICCVHKPGDSLISQKMLTKMLQICSQNGKRNGIIFNEFVKKEQKSTLQLYKEDNFLTSNLLGVISYEMEIE